MKKAAAFLLAIITAITGKLSWSAPPWAKATGRLKTNSPRIFYSVMIFFICIAGVASGGYIYWKKLPKPDLVIIKTSLDEIQTASEEKMPPEPLSVSFTRQSSPDSRISAARIDLADKKLDSGASIHPAVEGSWQWEGDSVLKFFPKNEWPAQKKYTVTISPEILEKQIKLSDTCISFETSKFGASFEDAPKMYTDPENRGVHQASATVLFTHHVDEKSIRQGLSVSTAAKNASDIPCNYNVTIDKTGRRAYILSAPLKIETEEQFLTVNLSKHLKTIQGGAGLTEEIRGKLKIPAVSTFFSVSETGATIIPDIKKEPEQTVTVAFSDTIKRKSLEGHIKIWLLPEKNPEKKSERWTSASLINADIIARAKELPARLAETTGESSDRFGLVFDAPEQRDIFVKIEEGIKSDSGYALAKSHESVFEAPLYPKEARILGQGGFMASSGNKTLSIQARGLKAVKIIARRLMPQQLHHLVTQTGGDIANPYFHSGNFTEINISETFEKIVTLAPENSKTPVYTSLDLSEYLDPAGIKPGVFFIEILGWNQDTDTEAEIANNSNGENYDGDYYNPGYRSPKDNKRTVIVTDLAVMIKSGTDKSRDIFVESVASGSPAADAEVLIIARNGQTLQSGKTGEDGHVNFPETGETSDRSRDPVFCMVKKASDITFLPFDRSQRQLDMSKFDTGGVNTGYMDKNQLNAFVFSDRGIYRPGETANLGFLVRSKGFAIPAGIPLELHISGPQDAILLKNRLTVPENGFFETSFPSNPASPTGEHRAELFLVSEKGQTDRIIGSTTFKIEEFEPDRMRMTSTLSEKTSGWALPESLGAAISLKNLFGAPAQNRKIKGKIILQPAGFNFDKFPGFVFTDPLPEKGKPLNAVIQEIDEHKTDKDGQAIIDLDLGRFEKGTYRLTVSFQGFDEAGGKSVRAFSTALVSPMQAITGYKADGDLTYIKKDSQRQIKFITVNRQLDPITAEKLKIRKVKIITVSALVRQQNGTYAYQSAKKNETVWEKPFLIAEKGQDISVETSDAGDYILEIRDDSDQLLCRAPYSVAGESNITAEIEKTAELGIKMETGNVKAGENIEFQITTPYKGAGLITVETDKVHAFKWFRTETLTSLQTIMIPENLEGNAYINVSLVRSLDDPEIFTSPLSYATTSFNIDRTRRELSPEIKTPEKVVPGELMNISYKAARPCRMVIFAVDEGILQFAAYKTPAPLDNFLKKVALEVNTIQTADLILPEYNLLIQRMGAGGDADAEALRARHLNPFARKNNKPAVFWSGILEAGIEEKTVSWATPDTFSGEVRVMAVAADSEGMGASETKCIVRGPFVVNPVMPLAVTPGDTFTLTAGVANVHEGSGKAFPVTLKLEADKALTVEGGSEKKLAIDEGSEAVAVFKVKTTGSPGNASVRFIAESGNLKSSTSASLSIRPPSPDMTTVVSGMTDSGKTQLKIERKIIPEFAKQKISVSSNPLVLAAGLESWLDEFPYGCTEQLLSRGFPALVYASFPAGDSFTAKRAEEKVNAAVSMLRERQTNDGGFAMWPGGTVNDFATIYAMHFLTDASQAGFQIPKDMLDKGINLLGKKAGEKTEGTGSRLRAYSIYLLTRNANVTSNYLVDLQKDLEKEQAKNALWKKDITASFMAASYSIMRQDALASALFGKFKPSDKKEYDDIFLGSGAAESIDMYLTAKHFPEKLKGVEEERLIKMLAPVLNGTFHTFEAAWTVMALGAWSHNESQAPVSVTAVSGKNNPAPLELAANPFPSASFGTDVSGLDIKADHRVFYIAIQGGFDREKPEKEIRNGLEITRELRPAPEKQKAQVNTGDDITAVLKIRSLDGKYVNNAAVTDMFAGCFSPDIESVRANSSNTDISYIDVREDRAVFYGSFGPNIKEIIYKLRVTAAGEFIVPPAFGESLYDSRIRARSLPETIKVEK